MGRAMKDSGVEWIGEIPEEWSVVPMKSLIISNDGGIWGDDPVGNETDKIVIRSTEQSIDGKWQITDPATRNLSELRFSKYRILPDDLLMTKSSGSGLHIGKTTLADQYFAENECYYSNFIQRVRINQFAKFYWYILNSTIARDQFVYLQNTTSGIGNINAEDIEKIYVPLPTTDEQYRISFFLDGQCAKIDSIIEKTCASVEEYKRLKQAVITQAVTKGVRGDRPMEDSGIEWATQLPVGWQSINPKALFSLRKDKASVGERQLTASQQYGIMYQDEYMERTGSKVVTVEKDFDILKHVEAGDFVISMRSFQGGLEYSEISGSISSAYVMLIPNLELVYPRFYKWMLKSRVYIDALQRTSNMVRDGQAMRYSNFSQVRLYTVPMDEQKEIAAYLDAKCSEIDALIAQKEQLLTELENYKKSLIYEYVTGKKEVPSQERLTCETIDPKVLLMVYIAEYFAPKGRVHMQKMIYSVECILGLPFGTQYYRYPHGPYDQNIEKYEQEAVHRGWLSVTTGNQVEYSIGNNVDEYRKAYQEAFGGMTEDIRRICTFLSKMKTSQTERVATLLASWNDFILKGIDSPTDDQIIDDVRNHWSDNKHNSPESTWKGTLDKIRSNGFTPKGNGLCTKS